VATGAALKAVKGGKTEDEFTSRTITLRGVEYTIRELDVVEYKSALKQATDATGFTPFQDLLDVMVPMTVSPSPAARRKPMPYPVYRTLEDIVNVMHFITLRDEAEAEPEPTVDGEEAHEEADPNS